MTIEFYTWNTPNGRKISIALEEFELAYNVHPINIGQDEQFAPEFVAISPSGMIPAIVDPEGPGRPVGQRLRDRRDPALPGAQDLPLPARGTARAQPGGPVADVADGQLRADAGAAPPTSTTSTRTRRLTPPSVFARRRIGFTRCWTSGWERSTTWPETIPSPTWRSCPGPRAIPGRASRCPTIPNVKRWYDVLAGRPAVKPRHGGAGGQALGLDPTGDLTGRLCGDPSNPGVFRRWPGTVP